MSPCLDVKYDEITLHCTGTHIQGGPKQLHISVCVTLNWYSFVKSQRNFIIVDWEDILNIACKLISTVLCDWHYLVVCQHNSWANFILRQHRKRTILFLQGSVETCNRCCGQKCICIVLLGIYSGVSLPKIIKFDWDFTKLDQRNIKHRNVQFFGPPCTGRYTCVLCV